MLGSVVHLAHCVIGSVWRSYTGLIRNSSFIPAVRSAGTMSSQNPGTALDTATPLNFGYATESHALEQYAISHVPSIGTAS